MPELIRPSRIVQQSYLQAAREFIADGTPRYAALSLVGPAPDFLDVRFTVDQLADPVEFDRFTELIAHQADPAVPIRPDLVHATTLWWAEERIYLGRLSIRHTLNRSLRTLGGHIGYSVRPSARRRGHATAMLKAGLPFAHRLGIDPALVTCDDDNVASRKVIEASGGVPDEPYENKLRYWVSTSVPARNQAPAARGSADLPGHQQAVADRQ
jgi:predicted acetyltransferase